MTRPIRRKTGPFERVAAESALVYFIFARAGEGATKLFYLMYGGGRIGTHDFDGVLVAKVVRAFDSVVDVRLHRVVLVHVGQSCGHTTLRGAGMASAGINFGEDGDIQMAGKLHRGPKARKAGTDNYYVVCVHVSPEILGKEKASDSPKSDVAEYMLYKSTVLAKQKMRDRVD
jgi:hypothetical protein